MSDTENETPEPTEEDVVVKVIQAAFNAGWNARNEAFVLRVVENMDVPADQVFLTRQAEIINIIVNSLNDVNDNNEGKDGESSSESGVETGSDAP